MSRILTAVLTAAFCSIVLFAQQPPTGETTPPESQASTPTQTEPAPNSAAQSAQSGLVARIAPGSIIPVQLLKTVDAKKAKSGDEVIAKVTEDLKNTSGAVVVPKDTEVVGHITEAQRRSKQQKESELAIAFDKAMLKTGGTVQVPMSIQAIIASPNQDNQNSNPSAQSSSPGSGYPGGMPGGGAVSPGMPGQPGGSSQGTMGGNAQMPPAPTEPSDTNSTKSPQPKITGDTKGVVGISNLSLSTVANAQQGSVMTSEKNNVKLESGTFMLLRVE
ncbi:MAG: hypothetical protein WCB53_20160 [Terriglobales bacterium]